MGKNVTTIPATINRYTANPIGSKKKGVSPDMPECQPTWKTSNPAMLLNVTITPTTSKAEMTGNLQAYILMKV